jgi:hypothetical protein
MTTSFRSGRAVAGATSGAYTGISELERGRASAGVGRVLHVVKMLGLRVVLESPAGEDDG